MGKKEQPSKSRNEKDSEKQNHSRKLTKIIGCDDFPVITKRVKEEKMNERRE